ncbi:RDD family protein [Ensifer sp. ENS04]|uniref:RDD family protein n=1 Tax=Ensifer sp. ENS04 TaxID=2769281 RepID=UPI001784D925|nr:RDD family protein [Ensifer sp. ENS04]MBD9538955.1 RDD family protein [Ensifer sp. ENS04]
MVIDVTPSPSLAGFWRRALAFLLDYLIVSLPMQALVIVLFLATDGAVQGRFGLFNTLCQPVSMLPASLTPPPPVGYNAAVDCRTTLAGFDTQRLLIVSKITTEGSTFTQISQPYYLGLDGRQRDAWSANWIALTVFVLYLLAMEYRWGATLGKMILGIRTANTRGTVEIPFRTVILRYLLMFCALIPGVLVNHGVSFAIAYWSLDPAAILRHPAFLATSALAVVAFIGWYGWIAVDIIRRRNPIYDRVVGTSVRRRA